MENIFEEYGAEWIGWGDEYEEHNTAPYLAYNFQVKEKKNVFLYISGLGIFEAYINGKKVADTFFEPGESNFGKRVYYSVYDITQLVNEGENSVGIILGNGQYVNYIVNPTMEKNGELIEPHRYQKHDGDVFCKGIYGSKKAVCLIMQKDEVLAVSNEKWHITESPIKFQSWYGGEDYDAVSEIEFWSEPCCERDSWQRAKVMKKPCAVMTERFFNPIRVCEEIKAEKIIPVDDKYIIDFGANGAGVIKLRLDTTPKMRGIKIRMLPGEELDENTLADQRSSTQSWSETKNCTIEDNYTIKGTGREEWQMRFCYHGFRYLQVENMPYAPSDETFIYLRLRADNEKVGYFETDNDILDKVNKMTERSIESNMFFAFTDCPQIEKLGWLETSHLMFKSIAYAYDIKAWVKKILLDISDSVFEDGYVPAIVPEYHRIRGLFRDVNWGGACVMTAWYAYEFYRDKELLEICFDAGRKYIEHLKTYMKNGLIIDYSQMGDWGQIGEDTPKILVENCAFYLLLKTFAQIGQALGVDNEEYINLAQKVKAAFHEDEICYNKEKRVYGTGSQSSCGCVLFSGICVDEKNAVHNLVKAIEKRDYHLSSGEVGLKQVFAVLHRYGYDDVVYKMVTNDTPPGYKYFVLKNLTTLPEYWNYEELWWGMVRSRNHAMMGHVKEWLTEGVLGVDIVGDTVKIKPYIPPETTYAKGKVLCRGGVVETCWKITGSKIKIDVTVPEGMKAEIVVPKGFSL